MQTAYLQASKCMDVCKFSTEKKKSWIKPSLATKKGHILIRFFRLKHSDLCLDWKSKHTPPPLSGLGTGCAKTYLNTGGVTSIANYIRIWRNKQHLYTTLVCVFDKVIVIVNGCGENMSYNYWWMARDSQSAIDLILPINSIPKYR